MPHMIAQADTPNPDAIELQRRAASVRQRHLSAIPRCSEEAIREVCYGGLHYRNEYYFNSLPVYVRMVNLAFHYGSHNILELGAGLSTALWARYANRTGAQITTIDADFEPMRSYVTSPRLNALIDEHVQLIQGVTI